MTQELQNGEHTQEWPAADRPFNVDDSDAPVSMDEADEALEHAAESPAAMAAADAVEDAQSAIDNGELPDDVNSAANDITDEESVNIQNGGARDIDATNVSITQGGARDIDATTVTVNQGGVGRIQADEVSISQGGVGLVRAEHLTIQDGGAAFAIMADKATLDPETSVFLLIAGSTTGDVKPVLDWRAALAVGAGFAFVLSALRRLFR